MKGISRREFIGATAAGAAALMLARPVFSQEAERTTLVLVRGGAEAEALQAAIEALGGYDQFALKGKTVVLKPNIGWDRTPEQAANTNPDLVAAAVKALRSKGATVQVFDNTCNAAQRCYRRSGIEQAAKNAGAQVTFINDRRFDDIELPEGAKLKKWPIYRDYLRSDLRLNMPILKHHSLAGVTMGLKNLMGVMGGERSTIHNGFDQKIVDISAAILPELTILDARRILVRNGPTGGDLADVRIMNTLIAGFDPVAVDAEGARLFGTLPEDLKYLMEAQRRGLGSIERPAGFREINLG
ncbi:MAG TPA: DUF362 domain-containing protein [bacterium]|jgi:uncharacterized protein (DUF362 family)